MPLKNAKFPLPKSPSEQMELLELQQFPGILYISSAYCS